VPSELAEIGGDPFNMTVAGLRLAHLANAVAQLHGETARAMWAHVTDAAPIIAITNGVHAGTWQDARIPAALASDERLRAAKRALKSELLAEVRARTGVRLDPTAPTIGFARRAATYKRPDLLLRDPERFAALVKRHRVQVLFAGKAHPADHEGKAVIAGLVAALRQWPECVAFLEDYDMALGRVLTRGADVWLNTPRRPMEASGTSGMKAAMNGTLNLSVLDGWWPEGCEHGVTGWAIGDETTPADPDPRDLRALYDALEKSAARVRGSRALDHHDARVDPDGDRGLQLGSHGAGILRPPLRGYSIRRVTERVAPKVGISTECFPAPPATTIMMSVHARASGQGLGRPALNPPGWITSKRQAGWIEAREDLRLPRRAQKSALLQPRPPRWRRARPQDHQRLPPRQILLEPTVAAVPPPWSECPRG
jgi:hypothetical protein